jgi:hypothetical protein
MLVWLGIIVSCVLAILKFMGDIDVSWFIVFLPGMGMLILSFLWITGYYLYGKWADRKLPKTPVA